MTAVSDVPAVTNDASPAINALAVTPADGTVLPITRALYVGVTGNVIVEMVGGIAASSVTFVAVPAGTVLPIRVRRVLTATTAASILALY